MRLPTRTPGLAESSTSTPKSTSTAAITATSARPAALVGMCRSGALEPDADAALPGAMTDALAEA